MTVLPPLELDLICAPLVRGDGRPERLLSLVERAVGQPLGIEFTPYAEFRPVDDRVDLLDRAFFGALWNDAQLMLVEGRAQSFCAFLSGHVYSDGDTPDQVIYRWFHLSALMPVDLTVDAAMNLMLSLFDVGDVYVALLGSYTGKRHAIGEYGFRDLWPLKSTLSWINAWSATYARHLEFPGVGDREHLWRIDRSPTSGAYMCALTEDRLDPARADHAEVIAWARRRFCQADARQS